MTNETPVMEEIAHEAFKLGLLTSAVISPFVALGLAAGHLEPLIGLIAVWVIGTLVIAALTALDRRA